jgi:glutamyl-tRNA reductase
MDDFVILHRPGSARPEISPGSGQPVWKTCLRQIAFLSSDRAAEARLAGDEIYDHAEAFAFLLEVVCGLGSPVIGETEVFGQFKNFVATNALISTVPFSLSLRNFLQAVIQSAKSLRAEHLVGLGSQGYGSLVRKLSKTDAAVTILGAGQLAVEIIPWLTKQKAVQVVCRDLNRARSVQVAHPSVELCQIDVVETSVHGCLVVAAPIADADLFAWLQARPGQVRKILDLRGELEEAALFKEYQFFSLKDVFSNIEKNKKDLEQKVVELKKLVRARAEEHAERIHYRPFGWEDLCV